MHVNECSGEKQEQLTFTFIDTVQTLTLTVNLRTLPVTTQMTWWAHAWTAGYGFSVSYLIGPLTFCPRSYHRQILPGQRQQYRKSHLYCTIQWADHRENTNKHPLHKTVCTSCHSIYTPCHTVYTYCVTLYDIAPLHMTTDIAIHDNTLMISGLAKCGSLADKVGVILPYTALMQEGEWGYHRCQTGGVVSMASESQLWLTNRHRQLFLHNHPQISLFDNV